MNFNFNNKHTLLTWAYVINSILIGAIIVLRASQPSLQGADGPKEPAAYYLVGGDSESYSPESGELIQSNKSFSPEVLSAPKGSTISFPNKDSFTHNVYSPEGAMGFFDLGSANTTEADNSNLIKKEFSQEGMIKVSCAVHPIMQAHIFIVPSKYHTASKDGTYAFEEVPPGTYDLMVVTGSSAAKKLKSVTL